MKYIDITLGLFFILLIYTGELAGQNYIQDETSQKIEEMAKDQTNMWRKELALTAEQANLLERKIIEYSWKRTELRNSKMNEEAKKERFSKLKILEKKDICEILTRSQYEKYVNLSSKLKTG